MKDYRDLFRSYFNSITNHNPYPWQIALFSEFLTGAYPDSISLPTGAGKTSIITVWLLALALTSKYSLPRVPRRITWVINRRQVVDQTVDEVAKQLAAWLKLHPDSEVAQALWSLAGCKPSADLPIPLRIATLRGEMRDDHAWSDNPEVPAIIVGTPDMIGSRLLCRGYGESKYHQPKSAGFLGIDNLIVNDEAHLTPAFAKLILGIEQRNPAKQIGFPFRVMLVSATHNTLTERPFLHDVATNDARTDKDFAAVFHAKKSVAFQDTDTLVDSIVSDALSATSRKTVIFVTRPEDALAIATQLEEHNDGRVGLITGEMRGFERRTISTADQVFEIFRKKEEPPERYFLVMTSAGEVGLNITASLCLSEVSDITGLSQRFGRLNRYGELVESKAIVYIPAKKKRAKANSERDARDAAISATVEFIKTLPRTQDGGHDVSPEALFAHPAPDDAKEPRPPTTQLNDRKLHLLFCSSAPAIEMQNGYALTMLSDMVRALIHGKEQFRPTTTFACRLEVPLLFDCEPELIQKAVDSYTVLSHEEISMPHYKAEEKINQMPPETKLIIFAGDHIRCCMAGQFGLFREEYRRWLLCESLILIEEGKKLLRRGMLDPGPDSDPLTDVADWTDGSASNAKRGRFILIEHEDGNVTPAEPLGNQGLPEPDMQTAIEIQLPAASSETRSLLLNKPAPQAREYRRELLDHHQAKASMLARECADRLFSHLTHLGLPAMFGDTLLHHDDGKRTLVWQAAAHGSMEKPLAKSKRFNAKLLAGLRHELKSAALLLQTLEPNKLKTHNVAAHHGNARPFFRSTAPDQDAKEICIQAMDSILENFYDLNQEWGYWGLAYLEGCVKSWDAMSDKL